MAVYARGLLSDDAQRLDEIVVDRRGSKRAGKAKGRRRDRRYENRLLRATMDFLDDAEDIAQ